MALQIISQEMALRAQITQLLAACSAVTMALYAGLGLKLESNSSGLVLARHES